MDAREANGGTLPGQLPGEPFADGVEAHVNSGGFGSDAVRLALGGFDELNDPRRAGMENRRAAQDPAAAPTQLIPSRGFPPIAVARRVARGQQVTARVKGALA